MKKKFDRLSSKAVKPLAVQSGGEGEIQDRSLQPTRFRIKAVDHLSVY
jgi:hypothetical protein